jgi:hypothetical protein
MTARDKFNQLSRLSLKEVLVLTLLSFHYDTLEMSELLDELIGEMNE